MTIEIMKAFGAQVDSSKPNSYTVHPTGYVGREYEIETDASTASYFFAAAAASKGRVVVNGIGANSIQGDLEFVNILQQMGAQTMIGPNSVEVSGPNSLDGIDISMKDISDTAPTLASIAPFASSPVRVTDIGFIQHKESDRVHALVTELQKLGIDANVEDGGFIIKPGSPTGKIVQSYDDHRISLLYTSDAADE